MKIRPRIIVIQSKVEEIIPPPPPITRGYLPEDLRDILKEILEKLNETR